VTSPAGVGGDPCEADNGAQQTRSCNDVPCELGAGAISVIRNLRLKRWDIPTHSRAPGTQVVDEYRQKYGWSPDQEGNVMAFDKYVPSINWKCGDEGCRTATSATNSDADSTTTNQDGSTAKWTWDRLMDGENFVVEINATIIADYTGLYSFSLSSDDGAAMFVDCDAWNFEGCTPAVVNDYIHALETTRSTQVELSAGTHHMRFIMYEHTIHAGFVVKYGAEDQVFAFKGDEARPASGISKILPMRAKRFECTASIYHTTIDSCWNNRDLTETFTTTPYTPDWTDWTSINFGAVDNNNAVSSTINQFSGNDFVIEIETTITVNQPGLYNFKTESDDGSVAQLKKDAMRVDGVDVVSNDHLHGMETRSGSVHLTAGDHNLRFLVYEEGGGAGFKVKYGSDDQFFAAKGDYAVNCATTYEDGVCSATCGSGRKNRTHTVTQQPKWGGEVCPPQTEVLTCESEIACEDVSVEFEIQETEESFTAEKQNLLIAQIALELGIEDLSLITISIGTVGNAIPCSVNPNSPACNRRRLVGGLLITITVQVPPAKATEEIEKFESPEFVADVQTATGINTTFLQFKPTQGSSICATCKWNGVNGTIEVTHYINSQLPSIGQGLQHKCFHDKDGECRCECREPKSRPTADTWEQYLNDEWSGGGFGHTPETRTGRISPGPQYGQPGFWKASEHTGTWTDPQYDPANFMPSWDNSSD
jgi:hypothetical protein